MPGLIINVHFTCLLKGNAGSWTENVKVGKSDIVTELTVTALTSCCFYLYVRSKSPRKDICYLSCYSLPKMQQKTRNISWMRQNKTDFPSYRTMSHGDEGKVWGGQTKPGLCD